jgi:hypothetical protein
MVFDRGSQESNDWISVSRDIVFCDNSFWKDDSGDGDGGDDNDNSSWHNSATVLSLSTARLSVVGE